MDIISISENNLLIYRDNKLIKTIQYGDDIADNLYKISNDRYLLSFSNKYLSIIINNNDIIENTKTYHHLYRNIYVDINISTDIFSIIDMNDNKIIGKLSTAYGNYIPHVDFNSNLIKDFIVQKYDESIIIQNYNGEIIRKSIVSYHTKPIAYIGDIFIYSLNNSIFMNQVINSKFTYSERYETDIIIPENVWTIADIFSLDAVKSLLNTKINYDIKIKIFYTSIPIISYFIYVPELNVVYLALIRFMEYDNIDVEEHVIENIIVDNKDKSGNNIRLSDLDDYGFVISVFSNNEGFESYCIYQYRIQPTTYRNKGKYPILNSENYKKKLYELIKSCIHVCEPLKNIIIKYM